MSDLFPNPQQNASSDDGYHSPGSEPGGAMGAADAVNPLAAARSPKRRLALAITVGAVATLVVIAAVATRASGGSEERPVTTAVDGDISARATAPMETGSNAAGTRAVDALTPQSQALERTDSLSTGELGLRSDGSLPISAAPAPIMTDAGGVHPTGSPSIAGAQVTDPSLDFGPASAKPETTPAPSGAAEGAAPTLAPGEVAIGGAEGAAAARQAALDARRAREAEAQARREAFLQAVKEEEGRLRGAATQVAGEGSIATSNAGASRFGASAGPRGSPGAPGGLPGTTPAAGEGAKGVELLPGTKLDAITVSSYRSDIPGGVIEAKLLTPLRDRHRRVVLPAGTRAFGRASASGGTPGQPAMVSISFSTYVTPAGTVIRDFPGSAGDPQTMLLAVPGRVDRRLPERVTRGVASSVLDLLITEKAQTRPSTYELPSPRDQAIMDIRQRAGTLINGAAGDENSVSNIITLPPGTKITVLYGLE